MGRMGRFAALILGCLAAPRTLQGESINYLLIDDFSGRVSALGTEWEGFTDTVMGGVSQMQTGIRQETGQKFLRMSGQVSLKNNGGFIQVRIKLDPEGKALNLSEWTGVELKVRGQGQSYYIFARNKATRFPWKFYQAAVPLNNDWQVVRIPWTAFRKGDFGIMPGFDPGSITSLAIVAYKKEFQALIDVAQVGLYR